MVFRKGGDEYHDDDDDYIDEDELDDEDEEIGSGFRGRVSPFSSGSSNLPGRSSASGIRPSGVVSRNNPGGANRPPIGGTPGSRPTGGGFDRDSLRNRLGAASGGGDNLRSDLLGDDDDDDDDDEETGRSSAGPFTSSSRSIGSRPNIPGSQGRPSPGSSSPRSPVPGSQGRPSPGSSSPRSPVPGSSGRPSPGSSSPRSPVPGSSGRPSPGSSSPRSPVPGSSGSPTAGGGGIRRSPGAESSSPPDKKDDKKEGGEEKKGGGFSLGGMRSRIPGMGGGKKDNDKGDDKKPPDKKDDKKEGGEEKKGGGFNLGGMRSRIPGIGGGKKDDDKQDASPTSRPAPAGSPAMRRTGSMPRPGASVGTGAPPASAQSARGGDGKDDKKDAAKGGAAGIAAGMFGAVGAAASRFRPGAKKDEGGSGDAKPAAGGGKPSAFGNRKAEDKGGEQKKSPFGAARGGKAAPPKDDKKGAKAAAADAGGGSILGRLTSVFSGGDKAASKAARSKTSKVPKVQSEGISLDRKLDLLGVGLVFGSLVLFFSAISSQQAAISGIHNFLGQLLGWGAMAVPIIMFIIGMWLIVRVFGDDAPTIDPVRISGFGLGYISLLILFQYIESFNYPPINDAGLQLPWLRMMLDTSIGMRSGGGWIGAELYYMLIVGVGEIGGFFLLAFIMLLSVMLVTRLSASEIAIFFVSIYRSVRTGMAQRAAQRRAERLAAQQQAQLTAQTEVSVSSPAPAELPAAQAAGALPEPAQAGVPIEQRSILFRRGGQTLTLEEQIEAEAAAPAAPTPNVAAAQADSNGGGLFSRFRRGRKPDTQPKEVPKVAGVDEKKSDDESRTGVGRVAAALGGGLLANRLLNRSNGDDKKEQKELPKAPVPEPSTAQPAASAAEKSPAAAASTVNPAPAVASGASPFGGASPQSPTATPSPFGDSRGTQSPAPASTGSSSPFGDRGAQSPTPANPKPTGDGAAGQSQSLGDLLGKPRPAASQPGTPAAQTSSPLPQNPAQPISPSAKPEAGAADQPAASLSPSADKPAVGKPTMQPKSPAEDRPAARVSPFPTSPSPQSPVPGGHDKPGAAAQEEAKPQPGAATNPFSQRMDRLNAIRSGQTRVQPPTKPDDATPDVDQAAASTVSGASPAKPEPAKPEAKQPAASLRPEDMIPGAKPQPAATKPAAQEADTAAPAPKSPIPQQPTQPAGQPAPQQYAASQAAADAMRRSPVFGNPDDPGRGQSQPPARQQPVSQGPTNQSRIQINWRIPEYRTLLASGSEQEFDREQLLRQAKVIEDTLASFGAPGRVVEVNTGPVITQFGVEPDYLTARSGKKSRVKVGAIAQLDKDLQLALGAKSIRIEAPVPGKGYVGIEVPNEEASLVSLRDVMEANSFKKIKSPLAIALGQSVDGSPISADLSSMPHLLIAGTTGSGKSVCVNSVIASMLVHNTPDTVKFIMVDPKRVELTGYNGIPHLVAPVVVELERIVGVLKWVTREMDERYKKFSDAGARNIEDYNKHRAPNVEKMPYIVVIIDELADLMMLAPEETERTITRIAALARATGIHLVIATQRPSVDVVTGLIKANFPARIAFAVAGGVDSRVILDQPGAERLLGRGDMLYLSGDSPAPLRLQGVFVSDMEINNIVRYWKMQALEQPEQRPINILAAAGDPVANEPARNVAQRSEQVKQQAFWDRISAEAEAEKAASASSNGDDAAQEDELYEESVELVRRLNKASVSLLQRRLRIGYTRAARLIDIMEERGVVGPAKEGSSKPRDVLPKR